MSWDSARGAERVATAYAAPDLAAVREQQVDLLGPAARLAHRRRRLRARAPSPRRSSRAARR